LRNRFHYFMLFMAGEYTGKSGAMLAEPGKIAYKNRRPTGMLK